MLLLCQEMPFIMALATIITITVGIAAVNKILSLPLIFKASILSVSVALISMIVTFSYL